MTDAASRASASRSRGYGTVRRIGSAHDDRVDDVIRTLKEYDRLTARDALEVIELNCTARIHNCRRWIRHVQKLNSGTCDRGRTRIGRPHAAYRDGHFLSDGDREGSRGCPRDLERSRAEAAIQGEGWYQWERYSWRWTSERDVHAASVMWAGVVAFQSCVTTKPTMRVYTAARWIMPDRGLQAERERATTENDCCPILRDEGVYPRSRSRQRARFQVLRLAEFHTRGGPE